MMSIMRLQIVSFLFLSLALMEPTFAQSVQDTTKLMSGNARENAKIEEILKSVGTGLNRSYVCLPESSLITLPGRLREEMQTRAAETERVRLERDAIAKQFETERNAHVAIIRRIAVLRAIETTLDKIANAENSLAKLDHSFSDLKRQVTESFVPKFVKYVAALDRSFRRLYGSSFIAAKKSLAEMRTGPNGLIQFDEAILDRPFELTEIMEELKRNAKSSKSKQRLESFLALTADIQLRLSKVISLLRDGDVSAFSKFDFPGGRSFLEWEISEALALENFFPASQVDELILVCKRWNAKYLAFRRLVKESADYPRLVTSPPDDPELLAYWDEATNKLSVLINESHDAANRESLNKMVDGFFAERRQTVLSPLELGLEESRKRLNGLIVENGAKLMDVTDVRNEVRALEERKRLSEAALRSIQASLLSKEAELTKMTKQSDGLSEQAKTYLEENPTLTYSFKVKSVDQLSPDKRQLFESYSQGRPINFQQLTNLVIGDEIHRFNESHQDVVQFSEISEYLANLSEQVGDTKLSADGFKARYEKLMARFPGQPMKYNRDAVNLVDVCRRHRSQCVSGTLFHQAFLREHLAARKFREGNFVVIHTPGHVLSGWMSKDAQGDWILNGVETTVEGHGYVPFGKASQLKGPIRVVDAEQWWISRAFEDQIEDKDAAVVGILKSTAVKYGIDLSRFEFKGLVGTDRDQSQKSLFSFGNADVPSGDLERARAMRLDPTAIASGTPHTPDNFQKNAKTSMVRFEGDGPAQELLEVWASAKLDPVASQGLVPVRDLYTDMRSLVGDIIRTKTEPRDRNGYYDKDYKITPEFINELEILLSDERTRSFVRPLPSPRPTDIRNWLFLSEGDRQRYGELFERAARLARPIGE